MGRLERGSDIAKFCSKQVGRDLDPGSIAIPFP